MKCLLCFHDHDLSSLRSNCLDTHSNMKILFSQSLWRENSQEGMLNQIEQSEHSAEWLAQHISAQKQSYTLPSCIWPLYNMLDSEEGFFFLFRDCFSFRVTSNQGCSYWFLGFEQNHHHGPRLNRALSVEQISLWTKLTSSVSQCDLNFDSWTNQSAYLNHSIQCENQINYSLSHWADFWFLNKSVRSTELFCPICKTNQPIH